MAGRQAPTASEECATETPMKPKHLYLGLCILGTIGPWAAFLPFLREHGLDAAEFLRQLFATPVSSFFGWDVIISSLVLWTLVLLEGRRLVVSSGNTILQPRSGAGSVAHLIERVFGLSVLRAISGLGRR
jgi:uncharacterized protein DUF2834